MPDQAMNGESRRREDPADGALENCLRNITVHVRAASPRVSCRASRARPVLGGAESVETDLAMRENSLRNKIVEGEGE